MSITKGGFEKIFLKIMIGRSTVCCTGLIFEKDRGCNAVECVKNRNHDTNDLMCSQQLKVLRFITILVESWFNVQYNIYQDNGDQ